MRLQYIFLSFLMLLPWGIVAQIDNKIDVRLLQVSETVNQKVVIILKDQVDTRQSSTIRGKDAKAEWVFNELIRKSELTQKDILHLLNEKGIRHRSFYIVNMISAECPLNDIRTLAQREDVEAVIEDSRYVMQTLPEPDRSQNTVTSRDPLWNLNLIQAPAVWDLGFSGQNVVVGGQDTGYNWELNPLKSKYRGWDGTNANHDYNWHDAIHEPIAGNTNNNPCGFDADEPCDDHYHGTHTMGTMVGSVANSGEEIGVAPDAKWIGCRNMDRGNGLLSTYVECFEWFLAPTTIDGTNPDPAKMPHVINNSWGCPDFEGCNPSNFSVMEMALNNLRNAGCVVVVSAGNDGSNCETVSSPAAIHEGAFSVGATNSNDIIAGFSSRGVVTVDGSNRLKPDISAPGVSIKSIHKNGTDLTISGTSMAGPHVAGLVALIISANPELAGEVDIIEDIIEQTAVRLYNTQQDCNGILGTDIPNTTYGYGRIDALAAVNMALSESYKPYIIQDGSIIIENLSSGLVMSDVEGQKYRIKINNMGEITIENIAIENSSSVFVDNASLFIDNPSASVILKSPNNNYWKLNISDTGILTTSQITVPLTYSRVNDGDAVISDTSKGLLLKSSNNRCFATKISTLGKLVSIPVDCSY